MIKQLAEIPNTRALGDRMSSILDTRTRILWEKVNEIIRINTKDFDHPSDAINDVLQKFEVDILFYQKDQSFREQAYNKAIKRIESIYDKEIQK